MRHAYADPIAQAAIDRLEARLERVEKTAREANAVAIAEMNKCDRLEAKVERLSSLVATYELDQQEDERIIAELRAKVAAAEDLLEDDDDPYVHVHAFDQNQGEHDCARCWTLDLRAALEAKP
jgi:hypothetical protein